MGIFSNGRLQRMFIIAGVFMIIALPRYLVLTQSATEDETKWVARAANFSVALRGGDLAGTYQSEHPGVTTMWAGLLGLHLLFPGYSAQAAPQLEPYQVDLFLLDRGFTPLEALAAGRGVMVLFNALALTLIFIYAWRLLGLPTALLGAVFFAFSPFLAAHTQVMHLDGLAGSLMLLSLMAFLSYSERQKKRDLLLSGICAGLAWLTKTPAFALGPVLLLITLWQTWKNHSLDWMSLRRSIMPLLLWGILGFLTFFLLWPAMWVEPVAGLTLILQDALGYAGAGHESPVFFNGIIYSNGRIPTSIFYFYPLTILWRSTPVVLMGLPLALLAAWRRWSPLDRKQSRETIIALLLYTLIFTLLMTAGSKKFDRYLMPIYPALHLIAAAGWVGLVSWFTNGRLMAKAHRKTILIFAVLAIIAALQFFSFSRVYPYYLSYYNPLLGGSTRAPSMMQIGWGEGLDAAGRYLSAKPDSRNLVVATWYPSSLSYYFAGEKIPIKSELTAEETAEILAADYTVLYIHQWQRDLPPDLLDHFATLEPEHTIEINGLEYARIYNLHSLNKLE